MIINPAKIAMPMLYVVTLLGSVWVAAQANGTATEKIAQLEKTQTEEKAKTVALQRDAVEVKTDVKHILKAMERVEQKLGTAP